MGILMLAVMPLGYMFLNDARLFRASYQHAVAMELVDGEMEVLVAGEWQAFPEGTNDYPVHLSAATNLPPGRFVIERSGHRLALEWKPDEHGSGAGSVTREFIWK